MVLSVSVPTPKLPEKLMVSQTCKRNYNHMNKEMYIQQQVMDEGCIYIKKHLIYILYW